MRNQARQNPNLTIYPPERDGSPSALSSSLAASPTPASRRYSMGSPAMPSTPTFYIKDDDDDDDDYEDRRSTASRKSTLPLFSNPNLRPSAHLKSSWRSVLRGRRARWIVVTVLAGLTMWWYLDFPVLKRESTAARGVAAAGSSVGQALVDQKGSRIPAKRPPQRPPSAPKVKRPRPPPKALSAGPTVVDVDVGPRVSIQPDATRDDERFLAYSPHSGYHNQRISLENALTLAYMLKRTLLVPPVWVGHAIPYIHFDKMQYRLQMASKAGLGRCKEFGEKGSAAPLPRECEGYFDWTLVHWDFLVDLTSARKLVPMRDRWDHTLPWLEKELGIAKHNKEGASTDAYYLRDAKLYDYRYYDSKDDQEPLGKFETRLDVDKLARDSESFKLLHVGTMFGTSRFRVQDDANFDARSAFRRSMVFKTPLIDEITEAIRDRLGGAGMYYSLHLRVGDGIFQHDAEQNMAGVWDTLCMTKMKQSADVCRELASASVAKRRQHDGRRFRNRRDQILSLPTLDDADHHNDAAVSVSKLSPSLVKRANSRPQREGAYHHAPLKPLPTFKTASDLPLDSTLACRGQLHTASHLLPFNAPLFIATDSKVPTADAHLALFFDAFPCTFILNDFGSKSEVNSEPVAGLGKLAGLRNKADNVPLAQFLYPQLDAQIAAYGRGLVGTPQSTYSRFTIDVLHQVYHGWDIVERG